jgi:hypothetical protein
LLSCLFKISAAAALSSLMFSPADILSIAIRNVRKLSKQTNRITREGMAWTNQSSPNFPARLLSTHHIALVCSLLFPPLAFCLPSPFRCILFPVHNCLGSSWIALMFGLIRRISYSVIPRPDRPWEDDREHSSNLFTYRVTHLLVVLARHLSWIISYSATRISRHLLPTGSSFLPSKCYTVHTPIFEYNNDLNEILIR